ncbi:MAG: hypothetical protein VB137_09920 [Burkholderia sp.]
MSEQTNEIDELNKLKIKLELFNLLATVPDYFSLTPAQVGLLLERSVKQLADDRTAQRGPK